MEDLNKDLEYFNKVLYEVMNEANKLETLEHDIRAGLKKQ